MAMLTDGLTICCTRSRHRVGLHEGHCDANLRVDAGDEGLGLEGEGVGGRHDLLQVHRTETCTFMSQVKLVLICIC